MGEKVVYKLKISEIDGSLFLVIMLYCDFLVSLFRCLSIWIKIEAETRSNCVEQ